MSIIISKIKYRSPYIVRFIMAIASGLLLASAFPPIGKSEIAWIALIPLLLICKYSSPVKSFYWGGLAGMAFWLLSLSWLLRLSSSWGPFPVVCLGWVSLSLYCSIYMGCFAMTVSHLMRSVEYGSRTPPDSQGDLTKNSGLTRLSGIRCLILTPLVWVGFEYLRSILFTGFPWNALGVSQYKNLPMIQAAEFGGVYAVSAVIVVVNTALALTGLRLADVFKRKERRTRFHYELIIGLLVWILYLFHGVISIRNVDKNTGTKTLRIAAIQPNIPQSKKWEAEIVPEIYMRLKTQTELALISKPDLVIWPETAVPDSVTWDTDARSLINELCSKGAPILVGALEAEIGMKGDGKQDKASFVYYNSSILFDTGGNIIGRYRKQHLVPFGEYLPFDKMIPLLQKLAPIGFTCSPGREPTILKFNGIPFSVLICFEDIMSNIARRFVLNGSRFFINQTNDAWFDGSTGSIQHMAHCVFRCVENRVEAVRCGNTGVTCFIDRTGRIDGITREIIERNESHLTKYRVGDVSIDENADLMQTFYTKYGDMPFALPCGVMAGLALILAVRVKKFPKYPRSSV